MTQNQMRKIIDTIVNLSESVGLANRKPGTEFANPQGDKLIFQNLNFYPSQGGAYATTEEFQQALEQVAKQLGIDLNQIRWTNNPLKGGFGIAEFDDAQGKRYYLGRYFQKISPIRTENNFPNVLPGGFTLQTKVAQKEVAGYKPTDVLTSKLQNLTVDEIHQQIKAKFGEGSAEDVATKLFITSDSYPIRIPLGNMNYTAFTNYFCEMLQPMTLVLGKKTTGQAQKAADRFLTQGGYTTCAISFGASKIGGLTDSTLTNPAGQIMGLSSKAELGAKASAKNLLDKVAEMKTDADGKKILDKYAKEISLLQTITEGSTPGALNTAVIAKIITPEESKQIMALRNYPAGSDVLGKGLLSAELEQRYQERKARNPKEVIPFFHIRASIANEVADWVNNNTDFGKAASEILNWGPFIQVYTQADLKDNEILLKPFEVVYPSTSVTNVQLSADKTFYSTGSKGNFTFKILYNGATDVTDDSAEVDGTPEPAKTGASELEKFAQQRSAITAAPEKPETYGTDSALGRRRRR